MGKVISVPQWGAKPANKDNIVEKFVSCDKFIRSKCIPPPLGSILFSFGGGKVTITGDTTTVQGGECEVVVRGNFVCVNGCLQKAVEMYCTIHREIEEIQGVCSVVEPIPQAVVA